MARVSVPPLALLNREYAEQVWKRLVLAGVDGLDLDVVREALLAAAVSTPPPLAPPQEPPLPLPTGKTPRYPIRARPRPADV